MNFDFGAVFTRAWQITWKNKVLWVLTVLPFLVSFLFLPLWLFAVYSQDLNPNRMLRFMENQNLMILISIFYLVIFAASMFLQIISRASVTLGIYRVEMKEHPIGFLSLLEGGLAYFWRILGAACLTAAGMMAFYVVFFACAALASVATMGLGMICIQPLFLLMIPLMLLAMAFLEQAEAAIIVDGMSILDASSRAIELIKNHVWKYVLITFVVYFVMNILITVVMVPFILPMFFFMTDNFESGLDFGNVFKMQSLIIVILLPIMTIIQGFSLTYIKAAMMVTYLRLTRSTSESNIAMQPATA